MDTKMDLNRSILLSLARNDPEYFKFKKSLPEEIDRLDSIPPELMNDIVEAVKKERPDKCNSIIELESEIVTEQPRRDFMIDMMTVAGILTAAVFLLRLHIKAERGEDGKWTFAIEYKPASSKLIQSIIDALNKMLGQLQGTQG
jgi:hypothetical protein